MKSKIIINFILVLALAFFQLSFVSALPAPFNRFDFVIITLVFILFASGSTAALWFALVAGAIFDLYSFLPFGFCLSGLIFSVLALNFLLNNFFTNRSPFAFFGLNAFGVLIFRLIFGSLIFVFNLLGFSAGTYLVWRVFIYNTLIAAAINAGISLIFFYIFNFVSLRLRPVFITEIRKY